MFTTFINNIYYYFCKKKIKAYTVLFYFIFYTTYYKMLMFKHTNWYNHKYRDYYHLTIILPVLIPVRSY